MEFLITLINALVSLSISLYVIKKFINKTNISSKVLGVFTATVVGVIVFELILYLLTTLVVIQCGGGICDMAYIALLFWLPFYVIIAVIVTTYWMKKKA